jgi:Transposase DDE domain
MRKRKVWVEPLFAEGKLWHGHRRFRLRRLERVNIEGLLIASAQNLKRLRADRRRGQRPASAMAAALVQMESRLSVSLRELCTGIAMSLWCPHSRRCTVAAP